MSDPIASNAASSAAAATATAEIPAPLRKTTSSSSNSTPRSPGSRRSSMGQIVRNASTRLIEANPPSGMWSATGQIAAKAPSFDELRQSSYSSIQRRTSQPIQNSTIEEHEDDTHIAQDGISRSSMGGTPFMTPMATPLAIVRSHFMDEPESIDLEDEEPAVAAGGETPKVNRHGSQRNSYPESKRSDGGVHDEIADDADLFPALTMMSRSELADQSYDTSKRTSLASKRASVQAPESLKRDSLVEKNLGKENVIPATMEEEFTPRPQRNSKNLDKFFGEKVDESMGGNTAGIRAPPSDETKRRSKNLDKFFGEDTSKVGTVANDQKQRHTRDFADMMEGDDDGLPDILFGREQMPSQSYDPSQRKAISAKPKAPDGSSVSQPAKLSVRPTNTDATPSAGPTELQSKSKSHTQAVPRNAAKVDSNEEEEEEEEVDWDEFMREFDERPPRQSKRVSRDMSKFFGEDTGAGKASGSNQQPQAPSTRADESAVERDASNNGSRNVANLRINTKSSLTTGRRTANQPAVTVATREADGEKTATTSSEDDIIYPTGYHFPPKKTAWQGFLAGLKAFWGFVLTPLGFLVTLYGLNVVAWGGMLFLLLCNASPAMCQLGGGGYDCNDIDSPRRVWVEIDSQILNALFCVTGFGLIPWRFRDAYFLLRYRVRGDVSALRRLAGFHAGWFRLARSAYQAVPTPLPAGRIDPAVAAAADNPAYPLPLTRAPLLPLTGRRAPATAPWKLDFVIWAFVANTALQACLSGFMWGLNRYNRPSWSTGLFVALACIIAAAGGLVQFVEGRHIKRVEGIPWDESASSDPEAGFDAPPPASGGSASADLKAKLVTR